MIIGVALRHRVTGELYKLAMPARHNDLFESCPEHFKKGASYQGFYDENGEYYSRQAAAEHVVLVGQPLTDYAKEEYKHRKITILFSEDVW